MGGKWIVRDRLLTRLETRTKELNCRASFWVINPIAKRDQHQINNLSPLIRGLEYGNLDPKDGDLYLGRMKSEETLMEVRRDTDVQIVRLI